MSKNIETIVKERAEAYGQSVQNFRQAVETGDARMPRTLQASSANPPLENLPDFREGANVAALQDALRGLVGKGDCEFRGIHGTDWECWHCGAEYPPRDDEPFPTWCSNPDCPSVRARHLLDALQAGEPELPLSTGTGARPTAGSLSFTITISDDTDMGAFGAYVAGSAKDGFPQITMNYGAHLNACVEYPDLDWKTLFAETFVHEFLHAVEDVFDKLFSEVDVEGAIENARRLELEQQAAQTGGNSEAMPDDPDNAENFLASHVILLTDLLTEAMFELSLSPRYEAEQLKKRIVARLNTFHSVHGLPRVDGNG